MDKRVHRPTPMKPGFIRYTTLLSDNEIQDDDIYFTNSSIPDFIPSTQEHNAEVVYPPTGNIFSDGINYPEHSTMDVDDSQLPQGDMASKQAEILKHQSTVLPPQKGRTRWSTTDTLVLIEAKRNERDTLFNGGPRSKAISSTEKWKIVQNYCASHGVVRTVNQCRDRWEHLQPDYKRIRDYEKNIPSGHNSYWTMTARERTEKKLPAKFFEELFDAMELNFGHDRGINPGNITIDTSETNHANYEDSSALNENDPSNESETPKAACGSQSTGKKRKTSHKTLDIKDTIVENNKLVISTLQIAEEGRMKRHEKDCALVEQRHAKDCTLIEQRMQRDDLNEEKMIKIEEQKINVQLNLVSALNSIGQAMLKISESFSNDK
ncbi:hypothetical protein KI387_033633 [Taxus chinensis]|uniref:Myb-like domain-containing protein n=1 Tax=Taxus chinensis TaxID=29808 RepID=A0AA38BY53_TAXCH|nr:hypothetical protein KI387_033633 [Taxus chinensis]